ncbi:Hypothetical protein SRAE_1000000750 [Strongyloides ratti]|uniref:Serpentine receptor class gamma n=1 Tax=Strongyloides ratti TaxID=34506 RepID=A0A090KW80_STRRB|nr:Hypothetical protein SRAE_1000000750 [Strongyloides ratti]CEF61730.1 Hypothetical protein SRAE_1000000750 [Strongyloides ratti]
MELNWYKFNKSMNNISECEELPNLLDILQLAYGMPLLLLHIFIFEYQIVRCNRMYNNYVDNITNLLVEIKNLFILLIVILTSFILNILTLIKVKLKNRKIKEGENKCNVELCITLYTIINFIGMSLIFVNTILAIIGEIFTLTDIRIFSVRFFPFVFDIATLLYTPIFIIFR